MRPDEAQDYVQDLVIGLEVEAEMEWDPIALAAAKIHMELMQRRVSSSRSTRYLDPPGVPDLPDRADPAYVTALRARVAALDKAVWVGCRYAWRTSFGEVTEDVWVRNTEHAGVSPLGLAENIAMLIAGRRVLRLAEEAPASCGSRVSVGSHSGEPMVDFPASVLLTYLLTVS